MDQFITQIYKSTHYLHLPRPVDFLAVCCHHFCLQPGGALGRALGGALSSSSWLQKKEVHMSLHITDTHAIHTGSQITLLTCYSPQGPGIYKQKVAHISQHTRGHTIGTKKNITSIIVIAQHDSHSRLPLSFYNTSTSDVSITNHATWVLQNRNRQLLKENLPGGSGPSTFLPPFFSCCL